MATLVAAQFVDGDRVINSFSDFLVKNGVLSLGSGIIFGVATMYWIRAASTDIILPTLDFLILGAVRWVNKPFAQRISDMMFSNTEYRFETFFQETVVWLVTIAVSFGIIHHVFRRIVEARRREASADDRDD